LIRITVPAVTAATNRANVKGTLTGLVEYFRRTATLPNKAGGPAVSFA
jgi:hypothetical protein